MIDAFLRGASFAWEGRDDDDDDDGDDESTVKPSDASFVLLSFNWLIFHWCLRVGLDNGWTSMFGNGVKGKFVARECERKLNIQDKTVYAGSWKGFMCASVCVWWRREYLRHYAHVAMHHRVCVGGVASTHTNETCSSSSSLSHSTHRHTHTHSQSSSHIFTIAHRPHGYADFVGLQASSQAKQSSNGCLWNRISLKTNLHTKVFHRSWPPPFTPKTKFVLKNNSRCSENFRSSAEASPRINFSGQQWHVLIQSRLRWL